MQILLDLKFSTEFDYNSLVPEIVKKIWPFSFNVLYFAALSTVLPFFVLFYQELGFSGAQIGLLTGVPPLFSLVASPFWTSLADAKRWHKPVMGLGIGMAAICILLFQALTALR